MAHDDLVQRIPLNTLAISFGLAGLADVWSFAAAAFDLPRSINYAFWAIAAVAWVWLLVSHAVRGWRSPDTLHGQLTHPVQGPIASLVPIVGLLLSANLYEFAPLVSRLLVAGFMIVVALFAGWLISRWMTTGIPIDSVHGGYFLPTVAGGLIAATAAAEVGLRSLAIGALATGAFFWVLMTAIILARVMFGKPLPDPLVPTLAIFVAPPAVAGTAWFLIDPAGGGVEYGLAAMTVVMLLVQVALVPRYRKLPFTLGFWSFTFPFAAVGGYGIQWLTVLRPAGWQVLVALIVAGITVLIATIGGKSLRLRMHGHQAVAVRVPAVETRSPSATPTKIGAS